MSNNKQFCRSCEESVEIMFANEVAMYSKQFYVQDAFETINFTEEFILL